MCVVCGCGTGAQGAGQAVDTVGESGHEHGSDLLHFGQGPARVSVPGMSQERAIRVEQDVLGENNRYASANRRHFEAHGVMALNLVSSPGAGKTTLLCTTIEALRRRTDLAVAVIEGDQQTSLDAQRIRDSGAPAIQVNTGKGCHLDAQMVAEAFDRLPLHAGAHDAHHHNHHDGGHNHSHSHEHHPHADHDHGSVLFIENVGNLVCPAMWDLGEAAKVVILSVTEGEDKPLKYPDMFAAARLMILNKTDLLPHVRFDVERCLDYARRVNPELEVLQLSAQTGEGLDAWVDWIVAVHAGIQGNDADVAARLRAERIAALEHELAHLREQGDAQRSPSCA
ncbi:MULTISPECIES: hydrogenase nickel incorporation protein HypB [Paraburkholderia]|uniref:Hydrogenase maturation factor HypB n=2 Tax=Paraburkholderia TaxID=1822464 RepID=A0A248VYB8_9BURK|nr:MULTISPECIES: hydrogenase nickel incorporation protein HypB [Paraburkholderia]ASW04029.1 hydrogenase accessory protein HypB [Paraburkholderia aromaticivorans]CAB3738531.1 Hydrogenase maturation factor HypB [Paraburkholderia phenoliruptrix]